MFELSSIYLDHLQIGFLWVIYISHLISFLIFVSRREPEEPEDATKGRDVFNEKPPPDELLAVSDIGKSVTTSLPDNVVSFYSSYAFILNRNCEMHTLEEILYC